MRALVGVDMGTTHCKAGLFTPAGDTLHIAARPMTAFTARDGLRYYDPERVWQAAAAALAEAVGSRREVELAALGITSMAETGLLLEPATGACRSPFIPWHDTGAAAQAARIARQADPGEQFAATGLRVSFKSGLAKILWLAERDPELVKGSVWLSVADYIAWRLTGQVVTDYSLAARTFAFDIRRKTWDVERLAAFGLGPSLFPPAHPAGVLAGETRNGSETGLPARVPVTVAGHDHIVAAWAAGGMQPGAALDSMGTAESLVGGLAERGLTAADYASGLAFGPAPSRSGQGNMFWLGGLSSSGGAVEWLRKLLAEDGEPLTYAQVATLLAEAGPAPGRVLYFPYLTGAQAPRPDPDARAAFVGLTAAAGRQELVKAVLQGAAYEIETIRQGAEKAAGQPITRVVAAGGGTRLAGWLQLKADVAGCALEVYHQPEAALLGAALLAGLAAGVYPDEQAALAAARREPAAVFEPDAAHHAVHRRLLKIYEELQTPLREASHHLEKGS